MTHRFVRRMVCVMFAAILALGASAALVGCEPKVKKDVHREETHKDVVIDEGPVVE